MATRRPKVPRITTAVQKVEETDGGDVIRADFGSTASGTRSSDSASHRLRASTVKAAGTKATAANAAAAETGTDKPGTDKPGTDKPGTEKPGTDKPGTEKPGTDKPGTDKPGTEKSPASRAKGKASGRGGSVRYGLKDPQRAEGDDDESLDPVPARAFSGRMLALAVVVIAITVMLAPTVKIFIDKSAEIAALEADIAARQAEQNGLKQQVSRWQDPNYVKQQARDRINMVMPGETSYWVFGSDEPAGTSGGQAGEGSAEDPANLPWVDALWESIRRSATD
jgi:cell division protein FtsB